MLKLKLQYFGHLKWRVDSLEKTLMLGGIRGRRRRGRQRMRWHHWLNGHEFEQTPGDGEGQGSLVFCSPWGCKESDTVSEWTITTTSGVLVKFETVFCTEGKERWKQRQKNHFWLVGGVFNKQGNIRVRLVPGSHKAKISTTIHSIFRVSFEALRGCLQHHHHADGLSNNC